MKLVTFENAARQSRIGALVGNQQIADRRIVDLHTACALYLRDVESEAIFYRMADALVPPDMRALFRGGQHSRALCVPPQDSCLPHGTAPAYLAGPGHRPCGKRSLRFRRRAGRAHKPCADRQCADRQSVGCQPTRQCGTAARRFQTSQVSSKFASRSFRNVSGAPGATARPHVETLDFTLKHLNLETLKPGF